MIKVVIACRHDIVRAGLISIVDDYKQSFDCVSITEEADLKHLLPELKSAVVVMHSSFCLFENCGDFMGYKQLYPNIHWLIVTEKSGLATIPLLIEHGLNTFIKDSCSREEVVNALHATLAHRKFMCSALVDLLLDKNDDPAVVGIKLTIRETEVLQLISEGFQTVDIAKSMSLSPHTVNVYRKRLIKKLGTKSPAQLVLKGIKHGLLDGSSRSFRLAE